ncbi:MAG: acyloxyacyl hydrolase [Pseudomonadota bacterium]
MKLMKQYFIFKKNQKIYCLIFLMFIFAGFFPCSSPAQDDGQYAPTLTGISLNSGFTYDPKDDTYFSQVSVFKIWDYDKIWFHDAPEDLRYKVEACLGASSRNGDARVIANVGMLAMYYLDGLATKNFRPYIEGGIGVIYTDYRVENQAYRFNFNPQAGIGIEFNKNNSANWFMALRAHHISNGGLNDSNRGQNSVVFMFGQYF